MTDIEAVDYGIEKPRNIPLAIKCDYCQKELRPIGRRALLNAVIVEWKGHEKCDCEGSALAEAIARTAEEARKEAEELALKRAEQNKTIERLYRQSKIGERFKQRTFETYIANEQNKKPYLSAKRYCERFDELSREGIGIAFTGSFGTGKTHLAAAITNELLKHHIPVIFGSLSALLMQIKETYGEGKRVSETSIITLYSTIELLVIDDIGKEKITDWVLEKLFDIINNRYEANLPIIITSNYSVTELTERLSTDKNAVTAQAITSRISEMTRGIEMNWEDYRKKGF